MCVAKSKCGTKLRWKCKPTRTEPYRTVPSRAEPYRTMQWKSANWVFLWFCRLYSDGLALGVWFMTSCCCLVEFGFSCFNHASIESWFANYSVLDILHTPLRSARCFSRRHRRALEKQGQKKQTKHSKQQDNTSMTVTVLVPGIRLFNFGNYCFNSSINFCD